MVFAQLVTLQHSLAVLTFVGFSFQHTCNFVDFLQIYF